jgi:hypothetical protein
MGQAVTTARDARLSETIDKNIKTEEKESAHYVLEQLSFLVNAANAKLDKYQAQMNEMWLDKNGTTAKKMVPGQRALRWERGYRVGVSQKRRLGITKTEDTEAFKQTTTETETTTTTAHADVDATLVHKSDGLDDIIDVFFSAGVSVTDTKQKTTILEGFKKHVRSSLHYILENTNAGEQEDERFFVFVQHNAIIRIDIRIWRYNFNSEFVMAKAEDVLAYVFCVSVVNHMDLSVDELTYLLSEHAGDGDVKAYVDYLLSVWKKIYEIKHEVNKYTYEWQFQFRESIREREEQQRPGLEYRQPKYLNAPPTPPSANASPVHSRYPSTAWA